MQTCLINNVARLNYTNIAFLNLSPYNIFINSYRIHANQSHILSSKNIENYLGLSLKCTETKCVWRVCASSEWCLGCRIP